MFGELLKESASDVEAEDQYLFHESLQDTTTDRNGKLVRGSSKRTVPLPEQYAGSAELRAWVQRNKDVKYVPSELLEAFGFEA